MFSVDRAICPKSPRELRAFTYLMVEIPGLEPGSINSQLIKASLPSPPQNAYSLYKTNIKFLLKNLKFSKQLIN